MVTANQATSATGIMAAVEDRDIRIIGGVVAGGVGGLFLAEELSQNVLPMLGMSSQPTSTSGLGASILVKLVGTVAFVALAARAASGGILQVVSASAVFGMLTSVGLDILDMAQGGGLPGSSPSSSSSRSRSRSTPSSSGGSGSVRRVSSAGGSSGGSSNGSKPMAQGGFR